MRSNINIIVYKLSEVRSRNGGPAAIARPSLERNSQSLDTSGQDTESNLSKHTCPTRNRWLNALDIGTHSFIYWVNLRDPLKRSQPNGTWWWLRSPAISHRGDPTRCAKAVKAVCMHQYSLSQTLQVQISACIHP